MRRNIRNGEWFRVESEEQFELLKGYGKLKKDSFGGARVRKGTYQGPGHYYLLQYGQPCPRGCCTDDVNEVITAEEAFLETKEAIRDFARQYRELLSEARSRL